MILLDTSVIVAWLDPDHQFHRVCTAAITHWRPSGLVVSNISCAELAARGRTQESIDEDLATFDRLLLDWESSFRAGQAFRRWGRQTRRQPKEHDPVLPDFSSGLKPRSGTIGISPTIAAASKLSRTWSFCFPD